WFLVSCPLAPQFGCDGSAWSALYRDHTSALQNITATDFLLYPFVWTFSVRESMLGNISPLFVGLVPIWWAYRRTAALNRTFGTAAAGLASLGAWIAIEPLVLFTRFLIVPLALLAIPLSRALVAAQEDHNDVRSVRFFLTSSLVLIFLFMLFDSRG